MDITRKRKHVRPNRSGKKPHKIRSTSMGKNMKFVNKHRLCLVDNSLKRGKGSLVLF